MSIVRAVGHVTPGDVLDWGATLDPALLVPGETIAAVDWAVSAADAAAGLVVADRGVQDGVAYALVSIAEDERSHSRWDGGGRVVRPTVAIVTSADRRWQRELPIRIARGAPAAGSLAERILLIGGDL